MEKSKALVVDDEEDLRSILAYILSEEGYDIIEACDGKEAIQILDREKIDIVVSDIRMPNVDGVMVLKHAKSLTIKPIVVMVSGFADISEKELRDLGAEDFISKPYEVSKLIKSIKHHCEIKKVA